jgi:hypothetical protein
VVPYNELWYERGNTITASKRTSLIVDPATWTRPWTAAVLMKETPGPLFEYACHEENYSMFNILSGERAAEKASAQK